MKKKSLFIQILSGIAVAGNIIFVLWIAYNGINESFRGTTIEKISYISLVALLTINAILISRNTRN